MWCTSSPLTLFTTDDNTYCQRKVTSAFAVNLTDFCVCVNGNNFPVAKIEFKKKFFFLVKMF